MEQITEKQIAKINKHLSKMTETQQDAYIQKLDEAGLIGNILAKFGSAKNNVAKLQKQKAQISAQLDKMIAAVNASKAQGITPEQKQKDVQALQNIKAAVDKINVNIQVPEDQPAQGGDNAANGANNNGNNGGDANGQATPAK